MKLVKVNGDVLGLGSYSQVLKSLLDHMDVQVVNGRVFDSFLNFTIPPYYKRTAAKDVAVCAFEGDLAPKHWRMKVKHQDVCFTFSKCNVRAFEHPMEVLKPPVDTRIFKLGEEPNNEKFRFLFVGQADERKGLDVLLKAWDMFSRKDEAELLIHPTMVEHTDEAPVLRHMKLKKLPEGVRQTDGLMSQAAIVEMFQNADAFVMPSRAEGWQHVSLEAMACGCNLILSQEPTIPSLGKPRCLWLVKSEKFDVMSSPAVGGRDWCERNLDDVYEFNWYEPDVYDLVDKMEKCVDKPVSRVACAKYAQRFDVKNVAKELEKLL